MNTYFIYSKSLKKNTDSSKQPTLLLIHGLESFRYTLSILTWRFRKAGWNVLRYRYPCHEASLYDVAHDLSKKLKELPSEQYPDYAIGYSMGGVILSEILKSALLFPRVLLLGSPLLYSQMAALLAQYSVFKKIFGPSLMDLAKPRRPDFDSSIEAATLAGYGPIAKKMNPLLSGANDGLVQVKEAHPDFIKHQKTIYGTHPELVVRKAPFDAMKYYLENGKFN